MMRNNRFTTGSVDEVVTEENLHSAYDIEVKIVDAEMETGKGVKSCIPLMSVMG